MYGHSNPPLKINSKAERGFENHSIGGSRRTGPATHSNVANIIGMQSVTLQSIAYMAIQAWIFNVQVVFDHSLIAVSSSYILYYPVLVLGVLLTWTSITRSSITPSLITLRLPRTCCQGHC